MSRFINPLKYQGGGSISEAEATNKVIAFISEKTGASEDQIASVLSQISQSEEAVGQLQQLLQGASQGDQESLNMLTQLFNPQTQSAKQGGKIQAFICKHAKGGNVVGCGCGGKVEKHQDANGVIGINRSPKNAKIKISPIVNLISYLHGRRTPDVGDATNRSFGYARLNGNQYFRESANVNGNSAETWVKVGPQKDTLVDQTLSHRNALYPDQVETIMKRMRPDIKSVPPKKQQGGSILMAQNGGLSKASAYYAKHANEGIIRKLQNFLYGRGYDVGELDGKFGKNTYNAIRQYQRDNGLVDDGMWGEDTNQVHRVLGAGDTTFNGSRSGAHAGKHTYKDNFSGFRYKDTGVAPTYSSINQTIERAIQDPEWFWGDSDDAKRWRVLFEQGTPDGKGGTNYGAILEDIWRETPDDIKARIDSKKLPTSLNSKIFNNNITEATNEAAPKVAAIMTAPFALSNPLAYVTGVAGGLMGAEQGRRVGEDLAKPVYDSNGSLIGWSNANSNLHTDLTGDQVPLVKPDKSSEGQAVGAAVGSALGVMAGDALSNVRFSFDPNYNPTGIEMRMNAPRYREINPDTGKFVYKPRTVSGGSTTTTAKPSTRLFGKSSNMWRRRLTGQTIPDYNRSGYFMEKQGGLIKNK